MQLFFAKKSPLLINEIVEAEGCVDTTLVRFVAFTSRAHAVALAAGLPRQDHVWITTNQWIRLNKNEFDEMPCKLDSIENPHSFEKEPTLP